MEKKLLVIFAIVIVASLSVAGCTTTSNTTNNTNQTTSAAAHNATLEKYLAAYKSVYSSDTNESLQAWQLTWINSTSANLLETVLNKTTNVTDAWVETIMLFPTTQDATNYVNAMNLTAYSLASTESQSGGLYQNVTGHAPQIYKQYEYSEGSVLLGDYKLHEILQLDNIVTVATGKLLS